MAAAGLKEAKQQDSDNAEVENVKDEVMQEAVGRPQRREFFIGCPISTSVKTRDLVADCLER